MSLYSKLRYHIVPPAFLVFFTIAAQVLVRVGNPDSKIPLINVGSPFAWKVVFASYLWAYLSLIVPAKTFKGPRSPEGQVPVYSANGTQYYLVSVLAFGILLSWRPGLSVAIYEEFAHIMACLNISALALCVILMARAPAHLQGGHPWLYLFYRGLELHPRLLGVDVKQLTNCRIGMMGWALLSINFAVASSVKSGGVLSPGALANATLINLYLLKFFFWETGYFNTLDITLDRAGYYLCWGCLVWVQIFYTFSSFYLVAHPSKCSGHGALAIFIFGCFSLALNYVVDRQKETFRLSNGACHIWGRPAKFLNAQYRDSEGKSRKSRLLTSGFWGVARHTNYDFEIMLAVSWSLPALGYGFAPFMYPVFLTILLAHRTFRDDEKCQQKYGDAWTDYCKHVPFKMVPGIF